MFESLDEMYVYFEEGAEKVLSHLQGEFSVVKAGRANPKILDRVMVDYYGSMTPLNQMANITVPEPRCLLVNVWDTSALKNVVKAINEANLGLNPADDGKTIRLVFPILTEERRKELVKNIKKLTEEAKVSLRNDRRDSMDAIKAMKKENIITEDEQSDAEKEIQKKVDSYNAKIDAMCQAKEKEIMDV